MCWCLMIVKRYHATTLYHRDNNDSMEFFSEFCGKSKRPWSYFGCEMCRNIGNVSGKKISNKKKIRGGSSNIRIIYCYLVRLCVNQHNSSIVQIILSTSGDRRVYRRFMVIISLILIILDNLIIMFNGPIYILKFTRIWLTLFMYIIYN